MENSFDLNLDCDWTLYRYEMACSSGVFDVSQMWVVEITGLDHNCYKRDFKKKKYFYMYEKVVFELEFNKVYEEFNFSHQRFLQFFKLGMGIR